MSYKDSQRKESLRYLTEIKTPSTKQAYIDRSVDAVNFFINYVSKNSSVLDVGCRDGIMLNLLKTKGISNIQGVELIEDVAQITKNKGIKCTVGDVNNIDSIIPKGSIDFIIASHVLEHVKDFSSVLDKLREVLSSKGLIFIEIPLGRKDKEGEWGHYINFSGPQDLINRLKGKFNIEKKEVGKNGKWIRVIGRKI